MADETDTLVKIAAIHKEGLFGCGPPCIKCGFKSSCGKGAAFLHDDLERIMKVMIPEITPELMDKCREIITYHEDIPEE